MADSSEAASPQAHEEEPVEPEEEEPEEEEEEEEEEAEAPVDRLRRIFAADTSVGRKATLGRR